MMTRYKSAPPEGGDRTSEYRENKEEKENEGKKEETWIRQLLTCPRGNEWNRRRKG